MFVCDVCGTRSSDQSDWFVVSGEDGEVEVRFWNEEAARAPKARHACCGEHVQTLVFSSVTPNMHRAVLVPLPRRRGGWNPSALERDASSDESDLTESLVSILDAIDVVLKDPADQDKKDKDEEEARRFDA